MQRSLTTRFEVEHILWDLELKKKNIAGPRAGVSIILAVYFMQII